jgi:hypothetical protein
VQITSEKDIRSLAFREACSKRSQDESAQLAENVCMRYLLAQLSETDAVHREESWFRQGIRALRPLAKGLDHIVNTANPVTSFEPAAASALAIVKSVTTVSDVSRILLGSTLTVNRVHVGSNRSLWR